MNYTRFFDKLTIAVDLDNTLAVADSGQFSPSVIGPPIPKMLSKVKQMIADGHKVLIFTARANDPENVPYVQAWCKEHLGLILPVTNVKTPEIDVIIDDKSRNPYIDVQALDDVMDIQLNDSSNETSEYMRGLSNGLIVAKSVLTSEEPKFLENYRRFFKENSRITERPDYNRYWVSPEGNLIGCGKDYHYKCATKFLPFEDVEGKGLVAIMDIANEKGYVDVIIEGSTLWVRQRFETLSNSVQKALSKFANSMQLSVKFDKGGVHG